MAFDPDAAGGVPFNPDTAGGTAFDPDAAGGVPHPNGIAPPDSQMTQAQLDAKDTGSYASLEPKEPGLAHLLWSIGAGPMKIGEIARGQAPLPAPGLDALATAAPMAGVGDLRVGPAAPPSGLSMGNTPPAPTPTPGLQPTLMNRALASRLPETDTASGESAARVSDLTDKAQQQSPSGGVAPTRLQAAGAVKTNLGADITSVGRDLKTAGLIDNSDLAMLRAAQEAADSHTQVLATAPGTPFDAIGDWDVPQQIKDYVQGKLRDLDTASASQFANNTTGPLSAAGTVIGRVAPAGAAFLTGHPMLGAEALVGSPYSATLGGKVGTVLDNLVGSAKSKVDLAAMKARMGGATGAPLVRPGMPEAPVPGPYGAAPTGSVPGFVRPAVPTPAAPAPAPPFVRPTIPTVTPNPVPAFVRPDTTPAAPNPAPPFIRPDIPAPAAPNPAPPFVRPDIPAPAAPNPAPPFVRPGVTPPDVTPSSPYGPAGTATPNVALMAAQRAAAQRAMETVQSGQDGIPGISQPDPETGLPANTAPSPSAPAPLTRLVPDTRSSVQQGLTADQEFGPLPGSAPAAPRAPSGMSPGQTYAVRGGFARDAGHAGQLANDAARDGAISMQDAMEVNNPNGAPLSPASAAKFRVYGLNRGAQEVGTPVNKIDSGSAQAKLNADRYQNNADAAALQFPQHAGSIRLAALTKSLSAKTDIVNAAKASDPSIGNNLDFLLTQGK